MPVLPKKTEKVIVLMSKKDKRQIQTMATDAGVSASSFLLGLYKKEIARIDLNEKKRLQRR